jgi:hypothetical protein
MTEDDLLQALAKAKLPPGPRDDPGSTVAELAEELYGANRLGTRTKTTKRLLLLKQDGRLRVGKRYIERLAGDLYPVNVYSIQ